MNYKQQLRGWAFDRVTELSKVSDLALDLATAKLQAEDLAEWAYNIEEDQVDTSQKLYEIIRNAPDGKSGIAEIRMSLDLIENERQQAGLDKPLKLASQH